MSIATTMSIFEMSLLSLRNVSAELDRNGSLLLEIGFRWYAEFVWAWMIKYVEEICLGEVRNARQYS